MAEGEKAGEEDPPNLQLQDHCQFGCQSIQRLESFTSLHCYRDEVKGFKA
jgi:hypothetical protein